MPFTYLLGMYTGTLHWRGSMAEPPGPTDSAEPQGLLPYPPVWCGAVRWGARTNELGGRKPYVGICS